MQFQRVDPFAEMAAGDTARQYVAQLLHHLAVAFANAGNFADMRAAQDILVHHQPHEFGMLVVIVERSADHIAQRGVRVQVAACIVSIDFAHRRISALQHRAVQAFLAAEIIIDHALGRIGPFGDLVDARAAQPLVGKFQRRDVQYVQAGFLRLAGPSTRLVQYIRRRSGHASILLCLELA